VVTIKPYGGLGNRIRVLYSILGINQELNHQIKILWNCNAELNCPFEELFVCPDKCQIRNIKQGLYQKAYQFSLSKLRFSELRPFIYDLVLYDRKIVNIRRENGNFHDLLKNHKSIYIETCHHFFKGSKITDFLTINPAIEKKAQTIYQNFDSPVYGIHVRTTDNLISKKYSPSTAFKELIREKLRNESDARFFLATDSKRVEQEFQNEFKDKIITSNNDELERNSKQGIKNALIDMICLSRTKKIYGSFYSSFSKISAKLSGIECESVVLGSPDINEANI
jgi:hypothetical protein